MAATGRALTRRVARRLIAAAAVGLVTMLCLSLVAPGAAAPTARALSCIPVDIHDALNEADFAFIGRPIVEAPGPEPGSRQFVFDVELWVKGNLGTPVTITGFEWSSPNIGERMAMIVNRTDDGRLRDNPCIWTEPATLLAIADLHAEEFSTDPPAVLVGGAFGPARVMALDGLGRLAGLGAGDGALIAMAACPGGTRVVELVAETPYGVPQLLAVRDALTLEVVREVIGLPVRDEGFAWPGALSCRDPEGSEVLLGVPGSGIDRVTTTAEPLHAGSFTTFAIGREWAVVAPTGRHFGDELSEGAPFDVLLLDLSNGRQTPLALAVDEPTEPVAFAFSPDEGLLAYFGRAPYESARAGMLVQLFEVPSGELVATAQVPAPRQCSCWGGLAWLDDGGLLVRAQRWTDEGQQASTTYVYDAPELELVDEWAGGAADVAQAAGGILLAIDQSDGHPQLVAVDLDDGRRVAIRTLATNSATGLVALPNFDGSALLDQGSAEPSPSPEMSRSPATASPQPGEPSAPNGLPITELLLLGALVVVAAGVLFGWRRGR